MRTESQREPRGVEPGGGGASSAPGRPLRVALVTHYMPPHIGGIELVAESLFNSYRRSGLEVRWIASRVPRESAASEEARIRVGCWNGLESLLSVPLPVWGWAGMRELSRLVEWADVVHVHDCLYLSSAMAVLLGRRARKKVLLSQHIGMVSYNSALLNRTASMAYGTLGRAVLANASLLVYCTPTAQEFVEGLLGRVVDGAIRIPNGIDTGRFRPPTPGERANARRKLGLDPSGTVILFVGRLVRKKGIEIFLEVSRLMPRSRFLVVGDGPLASSISDGSRNLNWKRLVSPDSMQEIYRAADLLLLPSYGEGFPLSVQEAMATGIPVAIPRGETFTRILESEAACVPIELSALAIARAIEDLFTHPARLDSISRKGRELVLREWSLEAMAGRYLQAIRSLAES
jgi:glycosyltransferase involved in cell wall biosynthesis